MAVLSVLSGCASYRPKPLALEQHREAWLARAPGDEPVLAFAARLNEGGAAPGHTFDPSDRLSIDESEVVALVYNGELRRRRARAGVSAAAAANAGKWDDPTLSLGVERILATSSNPMVYQGSLGLTLPISGRLGAERRRLGAEHEATLAKLLAEEWAVRQQVRRAWAEWSAVRLRADVARGYVADIETLMPGIDAQERIGELGRIEVGAFRLERLAALQRLERDEAEASQREIGLRGLLGLAPAASVVLTPGVVTGPPSDADDDAVMRRSPRVAAARADYEIAEKQLAEEIRKQYPDITIGPGYKREDGDDRVLLGLSLPLPLWNHNARGMAEAQAGREAARVEAETLTEEVLQSVAAARARLASATRRREQIERELAPLADQQREDTLTLARRGEINTVLVLEALRRSLDAKTVVLDARLEESLAATALRELVGPDTPSPATAGPLLSPAPKESLR